MNRLSWIFVCSMSVIVIATGLLFLRPVITSSWKIYQETAKTKKDLEEVSKKKDILTKLSKNNELNSLYSIVSNYIPEEQKSGELIIELTAIANQAKLKVAQISLDGKKATPTEDEAGNAEVKTEETKPNTPVSSEIQEIKFSLTVAGSFADFLTFLKKLETSSRLISISSMNMSSGEDGLTVQLSGKAYWKKGTNLESTLSNIEIPQSTISKFENLKTYGSPIDLPTESGFGRTDPFETY